jgi:hypothetical protein
MDGGRDGHHENCREHHTPNTSVRNNTLLGELTLAVTPVVYRSSFIAVLLEGIVFHVASKR